MNYDYCKGCETPYNCRWCPDNKSKDRCGFCGSEVPTEQAVRIGGLWKEFADTKKKLDDLSDKIGKLQFKLDIIVKAAKSAEYHALEHCMCCGLDPQKDIIYIKLSKALKQIKEQ